MYCHPHVNGVTVKGCSAVDASTRISGDGLLSQPLHPEIAAYLTALAAREEPRQSALDPVDARQRLSRRRRVTRRMPVMHKVDDLVLRETAVPLRCRRYLPSSSADLVIVFFHGGGWVTGDLETADGSARRLAKATSGEVLSVDYRLAPEHPFPAAVEDARHAIVWAGNQLAAGRPLVVAGDSAGGNLAAVWASGYADLATEVRAQLLSYPVLDCALDRPTYCDCPDIYPLRRQEMEWAWDHYLPDRGRRADPRATPLHVPDLSNAAPAVIVLAGHDPLREEGQEYASRLRAAGVRVRGFEHAGAVHGFLGFPGDLPFRDRALAQSSEAVRELAFGAFR